MGSVAKFFFMFADETQTKIVESDALLTEQMEKEICSSFLSLKQKCSGKAVDQFQNKQINKQKHDRNFFLQQPLRSKQ